MILTKTDTLLLWLLSPNCVLCLYTEKQAGSEVSDAFDAGHPSPILLWLRPGKVWGQKVAVGVGNQVPKETKDQPRCQEAGHETQQRVPENRKNEINISKGGR